MRFVVLGAGAVGGTIGGRLAEHGQPVVLLARGPHARAIQEHGLRLAMPDHTVQVRVPVVDSVADLRLRPDDALILTSKSQHGPAIVTEVAELPVGKSTAGRSLPLFCAQNGVANERRALRRFQSVYGVCVVCPSVFLEPGRVDSYTVPRSGILDLGRYPAGLDEPAERVAAALAGSGFYATPRPSIMPWKYAKLLDNLGNAIEALAGRELADQVEQLAVELRRRARAEGVACLRAAGIEVLDADLWRAHRNRVQDRTVAGRRRGGGSSWQSVARRTGSVEADYLNGEVVMLGRLHGVPTPVNEALQRAVIGMARDGLPPGSVPLQRVLDPVG